MSNPDLFIIGVIAGTAAGALGFFVAVAVAPARKRNPLAVSFDETRAGFAENPAPNDDARRLRQGTRIRQWQ